MDQRKEPKTYLSEPRQIATAAFIERNKLSLQAGPEIVAQCKRSQASGAMFNFEPEVYTDFMPWELAKEFYNAEYVKAVETGEKQYECVTTTEEAAQDFLDYMNFAWGKAQDERGISASRSIQKLGAWLWALGREDLYTLINKSHLYTPYGAPALIAVCEKMGIVIPASLRAFADQ